jgi:hypothetical protein
VRRISSDKWQHSTYVSVELSLLVIDRLSVDRLLSLSFLSAIRRIIDIYRYASCQERAWLSSHGQAQRSASVEEAHAHSLSLS